MGPLVDDGPKEERRLFNESWKKTWCVEIRARDARVKWRKTEAYQHEKKRMRTNCRLCRSIRRDMRRRRKQQLPPVVDGIFEGKGGCYLCAASEAEDECIQCGFAEGCIHNALYPWQHYDDDVRLRFSPHHTVGMCYKNRGRVYSKHLLTSEGRRGDGRKKNTKQKTKKTTKKHF